MNSHRLILSKKGFDSTYGHGPSPILADGRMVLLPIPEPRAGVCAATYGELRHDGASYADLLRRLGYKCVGSEPAHLDPDLVASARERTAGWRGTFGQVDQAESHLVNNNVGPGSLFLFWGWFAHESRTGFKSSPGFSAIYGYLEVGEVLGVGATPIPEFANHHPHADPRYPFEADAVSAPGTWAHLRGVNTAWMFCGPRTPSDRMRHLRSV